MLPAFDRPVVSKSLSVKKSKMFWSFSSKIIGENCEKAVDMYRNYKKTSKYKKKTLV
jgi:hypothetical protein